MNPPPYPYGWQPQYQQEEQREAEQKQEYQQQEQRQEAERQAQGQGQGPLPMQATHLPYHHHPHHHHAHAHAHAHHQLPQLSIPAPTSTLQFQTYPTFAPHAPMLTSPPSTVSTLPHPYHYPGFQYQQQAPPQIPQSMSPLAPQSTSSQSFSQLPLRQFASTPIIPLQQHQHPEDRLSKTPSRSRSSTILSPYNVSNSGAGMSQSSKKPNTAAKKPIEKPKFPTTKSGSSSSSSAAAAVSGSALHTITPSPAATSASSNEPLVHSYDVANLRGGSIISYDSNGHVTKPRVTTTMWEDEKTLCYQVEANGVSVVRRADNDMINGTKLLNVAKITRGRRDGILKAERIRHVVKIGSMHLKGVWIPFERAQIMAEREKIADYLYPLFVRDIQSVLKETSNQDDDKLSRISSPLNEPSSQGPVSLHQPNTFDPWYSTRNIPQPQPTPTTTTAAATGATAVPAPAPAPAPATTTTTTTAATTTILPQPPPQFSLPTHSRATPPYAVQYTPAHSTYRNHHPNTPNFDYASGNSTTTTTNPGGTRLIYNQNLPPPMTSVPSSSSDTSTTTAAPLLTGIRALAMTPTASDIRQQQNVMGLVPAPQPHHLHKPSPQILRPASATSDATDRFGSDSDSSKND